MWECPGCKRLAENPENLARHIQTSEKCMKAVNSLRGWQGMELDGNPKTRSGEILWLKEPA